MAAINPVVINTVQRSFERQNGKCLATPRWKFAPLSWPNKILFRQSFYGGLFACMARIPPKREKRKKGKKWRSHRCSNRLYFFRHRLTRFVVTLKCKFRIREQQHAVDAVLGVLDGRCMYVLHKEMLSFLPTRPGMLFSQNRMHVMEFQFFLFLLFWLLIFCMEYFF